MSWWTSLSLSLRLRYVCIIGLLFSLGQCWADTGVGGSSSQTTLLLPFELQECASQLELNNLHASIENSAQLVRILPNNFERLKAEQTMYVAIRSLMEVRLRWDRTADVESLATEVYYRIREIILRHRKFNAVQTDYMPMVSAIAFELINDVRKNRKLLQVMLPDAIDFQWFPIQVVSSRNHVRDKESLETWRFMPLYVSEKLLHMVKDYGNGIKPRVIASELGVTGGNVNARVTDFFRLVGRVRGIDRVGIKSFQTAPLVGNSNRLYVHLPNDETSTNLVIGNTNIENIDLNEIAAWISSQGLAVADQGKMFKSWLKRYRRLDSLLPTNMRGVFRHSIAVTESIGPLLRLETLGIRGRLANEILSIESESTTKAIRSLLDPMSRATGVLPKHDKITVYGNRIDRNSFVVVHWSDFSRAPVIFNVVLRPHRATGRKVSSERVAIDRKAFEEELRELPEYMHEIIRDRFIRELASREIADQRKVSIKSVQTFCSKMSSALRERYGFPKGSYFISRIEIVGEWTEQ